MKSEKGAVSGETPVRSPEPPEGVAPFQARFAAQIAEWKAKGCPFKVVIGTGGTEDTLCGAAPHKIKAMPVGKGNDGVVYVADCLKGHERQWEFTITAAELKEEQERQREALLDAERNGGAHLSQEQLAAHRDPTKATITIVMDVKTQDVTITDTYVPNPGAGALMAMVAQKYFMDQLGEMKPKKAPILLPSKKLIGPGGRPLS